MKIFEGKRTYIVALLAGIAAAVHALGWVEQDTLIAIDSFLAAFGLAFLRAGVSKNGK